MCLLEMSDESRRCLIAHIPTKYSKHERRTGTFADGLSGKFVDRLPKSDGAGKVNLRTARRPLQTSSSSF